MEKALPPETPETGAPDASGQIPSGLALGLAAEHGAETGAPSAGEGEQPLSSARRPGRPPTHGRYSKAAGSDGKNPVSLPEPGAVEQPQMDSGAQPRVSIPASLLAKVVSQSLTLAERFAQNKIGEAASACGLEPEDIASQLKQAELGDDVKALVGELTPLALQEWGIDPQVSPTAAIAVLIVPWTFGATTAYLTLAKLAEEKHEQRSKESERN